MKKWKDFGKLVDGDIDIRSSEIRFGEFNLIVHRHIHYPKDMWLASCAYIFDQVELYSKNLDEAKTQAKAKLQVILQDALDELLEQPTGKEE